MWKYATLLTLMCGMCMMEYRKTTMCSDGDTFNTTTPFINRTIAPIIGGCGTVNQTVGCIVDTALYFASPCDRPGNAIEVITEIIPGKEGTNGLWTGQFPFKSRYQSNIRRTIDTTHGFRILMVPKMMEVCKGKVLWYVSITLEDGPCT